MLPANCQHNFCFDRHFLRKSLFFFDYLSKSRSSNSFLRFYKKYTVPLCRHGAERVKEPIE